jgi:hypothetical protein
MKRLPEACVLLSIAARALMTLGFSAMLFLAAGCTGELRFNHEFTPVVADSVLNANSRYKELCAIGNARLYLVQEMEKDLPTHVRHDWLCLYKGDLRDHPIIKGNSNIFDDRTGLLLFSFWPRGIERDLGPHWLGNGRDERSAREVGITVLAQDRRVILFLDQRYTGGGSGGHRDLIVREYVVVEDGRASVTDACRIITDLNVGYPRFYGGDTWSPGCMFYSHSFDHAVTVEGDKLVVRYRRQQFDLRIIFASDSAVTPKPGPTSMWGERFTYNEFVVPRGVRVRETREKDELRLASP